METFSCYGKQVVLSTTGNIPTANKELVFTNSFNAFLIKYLDFLRAKNSPLLGIFSGIQGEKEQNKAILSLLQLLVDTSKEEIINRNPGLNHFFYDSYLLYQFVENFYNFWRNYERFFILHSTERKEQKYHKKPYRSFNSKMELLNDLVRGSYRDICENITYEHFNIYRQVPAGFQVGIIASKPLLELPEKYSSLKNFSFINQILLEPPLIINPPMNKRAGLFRRAESNPFDNLDLDPDEWLCYPAKVGFVIIFVFFHKKFIGLGSALANLFELSKDHELNKKPDAIYFFGVDEHSLNFKTPKTIFFDDKENGLMLGFVPNSDEYGYFGYLKKMMLTLHNIIVMKKRMLPVHGAMVRISLKSGKERNILLVGDSGAGKSESLEAFRILSRNHLRDMQIIFDDMGSLSIEGNELKAYGTETGAFVRLDDLQPGFVYGNMDRSIIMSPEKINARAVLPITTMKEVLEGYRPDIIVYANNYDSVQDNNYLEYFRDWKTAFTVFKKGARMSKGTTAESGLTESYFANPFGPPQYKELHESLAEKYFQFFFNDSIKVGEIKTMLGIQGFETKGPEQAAKALLEAILELD